MSNVSVQKVSGQEKEALPVFAELGKRLEEVRCRAHDLFQRRSAGIGLDLEDWLTAEREVFGWAKAELAEKNNAYEIQVALPGFEAKDVQVTATPEEVVVRATAEHSKQDETSSKDGEARVVWSEFDSSEILRRFELPKPVVLDQVAAKLDKGILHITAPCASQAKPAATVKQVNVAAA